MDLGLLCCFIAKTPKEHEICNNSDVAGANNLKTKSSTNVDNKKKSHEVKSRDRLFSNDTLNYVVEGIDAVKISPKPYNDDKEEGEKEEEKVEEASEAADEVFKSLLHQTTEAKKLSSSASFVDEGSFDLVNSSLPSQTPKAASTTSSSRPPQVSNNQKELKMISNFQSTPKVTTTMTASSRISFTKPSPLQLNAFQVHSTPMTASCSRLQKEGSTSTPISDNGYPLPKPKMSPFESLRSPLTSNGVVMEPPTTMPPLVSNDLISRKGGKNWRRSVNVAAAATGKFSSPNRRTTINYQTLVSEKVEIFGFLEGVNFYKH